MVSEALRDGLF
jgi:acetyl esterase/lipase